MMSSPRGFFEERQRRGNAFEVVWQEWEGESSGNVYQIKVVTSQAYQQLLITSLPHNPQTQLETREFLLEKRVAPLKSSTKRGIPWLWRQMQMKNSSNSARFALDTADHRGDEQWQKRDWKCFNSISWFSNETQNCSAVQGSCSVDGKDERKLFFSSQFLALHEEKNAATKLHSREKSAK
jgi:hypothetical protein